MLPTLRFPLVRIFLLVATAAVFACAGDPATAPDPGPGITPRAIPVAFAGGTIAAELATTRAQRELGLMNRASIAADSGMLFAWPTDQNHQFVAFFMRNTNFDLAIAFLDANKRVLNVEEMTRNTETLHFAVAPFRYALEAQRGWFAARGITAGATATFTIPASVVIEP